MNLKDFISWRKQCFFCKEELTIVPQISGVRAEFSIKDGYLDIASRYVNFMFHIETGLIDKSRDNRLDLDAFLTYREVEIEVKCLNCVNRNYSYSGIYRADVHKAYMKMIHFIESLCYNNIAIRQFPIINNGITYVYPHVSENGYDAYVKRSNIKINYIDLFKTTPEILENKIKTYIIFS